MPASRGSKQGKTGKGGGKAAGKKETKTTKSRTKKEGTRWGTVIDTRGAGKKKGGAASRDRLRDGS